MFFNCHGIKLLLSKYGTLILVSKWAARRELYRIVRYLGSGIVSEPLTYEAARTLGVPEPLS